MEQDFEFLNRGGGGDVGGVPFGGVGRVVEDLLEMGGVRGEFEEVVGCEVCAG
jgi:hypothetical protein